MKQGHSGLNAPKRILIVEDECDHRLLLTDQLRARGYLCRTAKDGDEALTQLEESPYDLVIADLIMPRMSGLELIRQMTKRALLETTKAILLTGSTMNGVHELARKAGAIATVMKPYDFKRLVTLITSTIGHPQPISENG